MEKMIIEHITHDLVQTHGVELAENDLALLQFLLISLFDAVIHGAHKFLIGRLARLAGEAGDLRVENVRFHLFEKIGHSSSLS